MDVAIGPPQVKAALGQQVPARLAHPFGQAFSPIAGEEPAQIPALAPGQGALDDGEGVALWVQFLQGVLLEAGPKSFSSSFYNSYFESPPVPMRSLA